MTNIYNLPDVMARLPVLQQAAFETIGKTCDAVDYWPHQQEGFPYWWNRIDSMSIDVVSLGAQDAVLHTYSVTMALVIAHLGADGFGGETTHNAYAYIPAVLDYFRGEAPRHLYDEKTYQSEPLGLWIVDGGASITGIPNGTRTLANSGVKVEQVAVAFQLEIPLLFEMY